MPKVSFPTVSWPGGVGAFQPFPLGGGRRRLRKGTGKRRQTRNRRRLAKRGGRRTRRA